MAKDERLLPLPNAADLQIQANDGPATYAPVYDGDPFAEKRSIREYLGVILKRKWMILAIITIATVSTAIYMYRQPSIYQSTATVLIETRQNKSSKDAVQINLWFDVKYWDTQVRLIQNPELMKDAVISLGLQRNPNLFAEQNNTPGLLSTMSSMVTGNRPAPAKIQTLPTLSNETAAFESSQTTLSPEEDKRATEYARSLVGGLSVEPVEKTNLITLKYVHTNPELVVLMPNAVAKAFIAKDTKREMQGSLLATEDNARQIADLQQNINRLEQERFNYLKAADLPLQANGQNLLEARLTEYSSQWLKAEDERRKLQAEYEAALRAKNAGDPYGIPAMAKSEVVKKARELNQMRISDLEKRIEAFDKQISDLEGKKSELLVRYTPEFPAVRAIDEQITTARQIKERTQREVSAKIETDSKKLVSTGVSEVLSVLRADYEAATKKENQAKAAYFQERQAANLQGQSTIKLTSLTQEIETNRKLLDGALQRQKELELAANNSRPNNITIATPAQNASLVGPNRQRSIMIAFLMSLAAGIGLAFLLDYLDDSIKSSDDIGRHLGLPTLALIPHHTTFERPGIRGKLAAANGAGSGAPESLALASLDDSRSAVAEAYRHLRTSLLFSSAGKPPQAILVTSSQPSEGKTTTAINTAITLAQAGAEVVLVDCDLRRPRLHHHFQLDNTHGLTNFLSGERNTGELLKVCDKLPNLKIVTSGPIPPNPAELLSSMEMRNLIDFLKTNFKHVVVDSPPAISFTDAAILSTLVDGVVIVAMAGKSSIHLIKRFKQRLNGVGARIYGVVLNGLKRHSSDYGYGYYGYGYSYYYNYYAEDEETTTTAATTAATNGNGNGKLS
ncbi:MAG TPA: polysaccharide biosynthesis tyrosine autokinase [Pyrinomonadaceae bacterium]|nr:polysaccharide biosynthesis tyrosine autokinase [Pyrinomonadaceae bacterium]